MFTQEEKMQLFNRLPALELSYGPKLHKKVYSAVYYIIPKGPKALVWYTYWREQHVCLLILLNERGNYSDIKVFSANFSDALALGTIIYGTHFMYKNRPYFTCEQLHYYKGIHVMEKYKSYLERLHLLTEMFQKEVEQVAYTMNSLVVGLPAMTETYEEALTLLEENALPYRVYGIGGAPLQPPGGKPPQPPFEGKHPYTPGGKPSHTPGGTTLTPLEGKFVERSVPKGGCGGLPPGGCRGAPPKVLVVRADLAPDTYHLYNPTNNAFIGTAMIPTYKCSVFLNSLFRNIKENKNLDLLEESDDEDDFENIELNKFVDLDKTILMECVFLKKFQKWQPLKQIIM